MKSVRAAASAVGLVLLGALAGAAGMHLYYAQEISGPAERERGGPPWLLGERLGRQLDLNPDQQQAARRIFEETRREAEELRDDIRPRFEEVMERGTDRLMEILTPEQRERYREIQDRHRERRESFLRGPRGSRGSKGGPHRGPLGRGERSGPSDEPSAPGGPPAAH